MRRLFAITAFLAAATPVLAADDVFPEEAMDALMRVTMASTADGQCEGITARQARVQKAMVAMLTQVQSLGASPVQAVEYLKTEEGAARIKSRETALREKYGISADDPDGLCAAIRAEAGVDAELAKLVQIK